MSQNHLFSHPLFKELFDHHLVSADGRIIVSEKRLRDHLKFVEEQYLDKTKNRFKQRNEFVEEILAMLKSDHMNDTDEERMTDLLDKLGLERVPGPLVSLKDLDLDPDRYAGPRSQKKSRTERKLAEDERRKKTLRRDLKELEDWLHELYVSDARVEEEVDQMKGEYGKFRQRTKARDENLVVGRKRVIDQYNLERTVKMKRMLQIKKKNDGRMTSSEQFDTPDDGPSSSADQPSSSQDTS